jgi:hypothetical protein
MDEYLEHLYLTRDDRSAVTRTQLSHARRRGELHHVCEGAYLPMSVWAELDDRRRHLVLAHAARAVRNRRLVFSHWTAAAAWDLPRIGRLPESVHVVAERATGGRTDDHLVRHSVGIPETTEWRSGLEVTSLERTLVDVARVAAFPAAIVVADAALALLGPGVDLTPQLGSARSRGVAKARRVVEFADPRSGSPGESLSRASMALAGIPEPVLQHAFDDAEGRMFADFWWPQFGIVGEFDGAIKYDDPAFLAGRTPRQALLDEKHREDRIRALGPRVTRWGWAVARNPARLRAHLLAAGIRDVRYRAW